jgi:hypothetical protein
LDPSIEAREESDALDETKDEDKKLLLAKTMSSLATCLLSLSLSEKVSQMALYNCKTTDLCSQEAAKAWKNHFKLYHFKKLKKMNELKDDFVRSKRQTLMIGLLI